MKRVVLTILLVISMLLLAACSAGTATQAAQPDTSSQTSTDGQPTTESLSSTGASTFALVAAETEARFVINEVLNGAPKTVVGATNGVTGTISPDFTNPANTTVSTITVDLSTLSTDSGMRNRAIRDMILQTGANQYAEFAPTSLSGMPASITIGQPFSFQIVGNLTIKGVSNEVTFDVTATPVSETRIEGLATLKDVNYSDWGVSVLRLPPQVASVEDIVTLELEFVAESQG